MRKREGVNRDRLERVEHGGMFLQSQTPGGRTASGRSIWAAEMLYPKIKSKIKINHWKNI